MFRKRPKKDFMESRRGLIFYITFAITFSSYAGETRFYYIVQSRYTALTASDPESSASAKILTSRDLELRPFWIQKWNKSTETFQSISIRNVAFAPADGSNKSLGTKEKSTKGLSLGLSHSFGEKSQIQISANYTEVLFLKALSTEVIEVDAAPIPSFGLKGIFSVYRGAQTDMGYEVEGHYFLETSASGYTVKPGYGYQGGIYFKHKRPGGAFGVSMGFSQQNQSTTSVKQSEAGFYGAVKIFD